MSQYEKMTSVQLADEFAKWKKTMNQAKGIVDQIKAELQKRGLKMMEDKNIKTSQIWGSENNFALVQKTQSLKVMDYMTIVGLLKTISGEHITKVTEPTYVFSKDFKAGLTAVFTDQYETREVKDILSELGLSDTTIELVTKKLKGTWVKDQELLKSVGVKQDLDLYLYFIHQSMAYYKLVKVLTAAGYERHEIPMVVTQLKKTVIVEENTKIGCQYK